MKPGGGAIECNIYSKKLNPVTPPPPTENNMT